MRIGINAHLLSFDENYRQAGLSRYIYELVTRLPAIDTKDRFTAFVGNAPMPAEFVRSRPRNLRFSLSRLPTASAPIRIGWEQAVLPFAAARERLDVLLCPVNVRPLVCPCPAVVTVHDLIFLRYPENFKPAKRRYLAAMTAWSARHAAHIIAVSEATRKDVIDLMGVAPDKVTTVYNGVGEQFKPLEEKANAEFKRRKELKGRIIFYVGTLEPRKNLVMLLQAFGAIAGEPAHSDVTLVIGGSKGWYYDEIYATADRLGLSAQGRVRFLGRVSDEELPLWYNVASVFTYPSQYEGFGLPALEAMACGTPVIASNTSSLPEVVGDAGILLDPTEPVEWANALRQTLADAQAAGQLRAKGLVQARMFSWERTARETLDVLRSQKSVARNQKSEIRGQSAELT